MIDAHIHLDQYAPATLENQLKKWEEAGVERVIAVSNDLASSYQTLELQQKYPWLVAACLGFHPEHPIPSERDVEEWKRLIHQERQRIVAIGEIGLPHYELDRLPYSLDHATYMLQCYLNEAVSFRLPVALHAVHDKAEIAFKLLQEKGIKNAHFHWLKAPPEVVKKIIRAGYYISVTPEVCYRERDQQLATVVPLSQLLIETDGPWSFEGEFHHKDTTPLFLPKIIRQLATLKNKSEDEIRVQTVLNTKRCYGLL